MNILSVLYCETLKVVRSKVFWLTFVFFSISFGITIALGMSPRLWTLFLDTFMTMHANEGMLISFFIAAWVFGREFSDKTNKDLIVKPISRTTVVLSKFIIIVLWYVVFMIFLLLFDIVLVVLLGFTGFTTALFYEALSKYIITSLFYTILCLTGAFFASISRGILAPIGILFVIVVASNMLANTGVAVYFPWTIPSVFLQTGSLNLVSIIILIATGLAGLIGTLAWWRFAEQK